MIARLLVAASLVAVATPALAQSPARVDVVDQAMVNTVAANLKRRGITTVDPLFQKTIDRYNARVVAQAAAGCTQAAAQGCTTATSGWGQIFRALGADLPWPFDVGLPGSKVNLPANSWGGSGDFGGGGASDQWTLDCRVVNFKLDDAGNLVLPSQGYKLEYGREIEVTGNVSYGTTFYGNAMAGGGSGGAWGTIVTTGRTSVLRRALHQLNLNRPKHMWYGVLNRAPDNNGFECWNFASVAKRGTDGVLANRSQTSHCAGNSQMTFGTALNVNDQYYGNTATHKSCPQEGGGAAYHFYATGVGAGHVDDCTWFVPDYSLSKSGYAISDETSLPYASAWNWPAMLPDELRHCPIDPKLMAKVADALVKDAAKQPGYDGAPAQTIEEQDARPGDSTVKDLNDQPTSKQPNAGANDPPPTTPTTPTTPGTGTTVDLGPNPGIGAPTLDEPPTGIMDPIFDWLPDLPSITLNTNGTQCPTWVFNLTEFAPDWLFMMDSHCDVVEQNREAIGALMIVLFGLGAGMIILRA